MQKPRNSIEWSYGTLLKRGRSHVFALDNRRVGLVQNATVIGDRGTPYGIGLGLSRTEG